MCGRYYRKSGRQHISDVFSVYHFDELAHEVRPSYNISPGTGQPAVRLDKNGECELVVMQWTLVPRFSEQRKSPYETSIVSADTITKLDTFSESFAKRRCLIPADGFMQWEALPNHTKQPWAFAAKSGELMGFAGVWDRWADPETGDVLDSFAMITTEPNEIAVDMREQMPIAIEREDYQRWLEPGDPMSLPLDLLRPFPSEQMAKWKIDKHAGNPRNNWPELIDPLSDKPKRSLLD
jgi:putative SOS response-associated peptidase YedK